MNSTYVLPKDELGEALYRRIHLLIKKNRGAWATRGAACGLAGGMLAILLGALLWAVVPLLAEDNLRTFLYTLETTSFVMPLPLLALGAYCLDLLEERPPLFPLEAKSQPAAFERPFRLRAHRPHQN